MPVAQDLRWRAGLVRHVHLAHCLSISLSLSRYLSPTYPISRLDGASSQHAAAPRCLSLTHSHSLSLSLSLPYITDQQRLESNLPDCSLSISLSLSDSLSLSLSLSPFSLCLFPVADAASLSIHFERHLGNHWLFLSLSLSLSLSTSLSIPLSRYRNSASTGIDTPE